MKLYPLAKPYITPADRRSVLAVLKTPYLSLGPKIQQFENQFAKFIGTKYACGISSGTAGLHLAILASNIKAGDEVITTPFSFVASANCILYVGARPVFVDIDPLTYNMDPAQIEDKITKKTKAILVVHIFGQAVNMAPILRLAKKYHLTIIEDACEAIGATYKGRNVGTFGETAVFAFYPNKQMTTGEGGMIVTNNEKTYELCRSLRNQGRSDNMQWLDHKYLGYNYRLDEMSAALGLAQLERLPRMIRKRQTIAGWYAKYLAPYSGLIQIPKVVKPNTHTWFVYVVKILKSSINRDKIILKLNKKFGIETKPYLPSIHLFDFYKKRFNYRPGAFPVSEEMSRHSLALPFYLTLKKQDVKYICKQLINILKRHV